MNKIYLLITALFVFLFSCTEDKIMTYKSSVDYLQFSKSVKDSTICSFLAFPNDMERQIPLVVELTGFSIPSDRTYKISVVPELSSAQEMHYTPVSEFTFRANRHTDTCWINIKKTPDLLEKTVRLVFQLVENDEFKIGQTEFSMAVLSITNKISKPVWWTNTVTNYYLGYYSDKKYRLFITATGKAEIDNNDAEELLNEALLFKYYLRQEKEAGRTVYEDDGTEMTVSLIVG